MHDLRCGGHTARGDCNRLLGKAAAGAAVEIKCPSCKTIARFKLVETLATPPSTAA